MNIGIFGATGLIGRNFINILNENRINITPKLFASEKSVGKYLTVNHKKIFVEKLSPEVFDDLTHAFFFLPSDVVKEFAPYAIKNNVIVIDNSSCFRMNDNIPLIIDEINGYLINYYKYLVNPNCTTIQGILPLYYLDKYFEIKEINYATYQSLSGGGNNLLNEFKKKKLFESTLPFIGDIKDDNHTSEEQKMIQESHKILGKNIPIRAICVRIPSKYCHGCYVDATFKKELKYEKCIEALAQKRIKVTNRIRMQKGRDDILIPRLVLDKYDKHRLQFYCIADNLRVGASYNSFLIGKRLNLF